ncbi:Alpha/Beta hydrolase protein [Bisporella sp. PMI_857]|nr:Alpha/Beta hydrolase protein [Bisporella sp. PMI_857]
MHECCVKGFQWDGTPVGTAGKLGNNDAYITGSNDDIAIMAIHDAFGWTFENTRLLADHYAREIGATVYVPDFFGGEILPADILRDFSRFGELDMKGFMARNSKANRESEILSCARVLRPRYKRVGVIGFCFGGWGVFRLGAKSHVPPLVDCISTAHPSALEKSEIKNVGVPVQIIAPEFDMAFTPELKEFANRVIPTLGVPYDYQLFPGVEHAFATRGNPNSKKEQKAMVRAKNCAVSWLHHWLHVN